MGAKDVVEDPIQYWVDLSKIHPNKFSEGTNNPIAKLISIFHDPYVEWKQRQPDYESEVCSICMEPCDEDPAYQSCGHAFHEPCIARWKNQAVSNGRRPVCPMGRCTMLHIYK